MFILLDIQRGRKKARKGIRDGGHSTTPLPSPRPSSSEKWELFDFEDDECEGT